MLMILVSYMCESTKFSPLWCGISHMISDHSPSFHVPPTKRSSVPTTSQPLPSHSLLPPPLLLLAHPSQLPLHLPHHLRLFHPHPSPLPVPWPTTLPIPVAPSLIGYLPVVRRPLGGVN